MGRRWVMGRKRDPFYCRAKREGYRSRAAYKLIQMNGRFNLFGEGDAVVDLGASPGGWSQVAAGTVGPSGRVVAVDIARVAAIDGVTVIRGDVRSGEVMAAVGAALGRPARAVISDMSPDISGVYTADHERSVELAETALGAARRLLGPGGNLLVKVFQGESLRRYVEKVSGGFSSCRVHKPAASRGASSEVYVVGRGFGGGLDG